MKRVILDVFRKGQCPVSYGGQTIQGKLFSANVRDFYISLNKIKKLRRMDGVKKRLVLEEIK